jgi:antitoxin ParD1/3/4
MNVSLTPELEKFVTKEVGSGLYQTASEVIRAGLRRLKEDRVRQLRLPETLAELETQLLESVESLDAGKGVNGEEVIRRLRKRMSEPFCVRARPPSQNQQQFCFAGGFPLSASDSGQHAQGRHLFVERQPEHARQGASGNLRRIHRGFEPVQIQKPARHHSTPQNQSAAARRETDCADSGAKRNRQRHIHAA